MTAFKRMTTGRQNAAVSEVTGDGLSAVCLGSGPRPSPGEGKVDRVSGSVRDCCRVGVGLDPWAPEGLEIPNERVRPGSGSGENIPIRQTAGW